MTTEEELALLRAQVEQMQADPVVDEPLDNPPPTPLHRWDGTAWVLPAEHEISMLDQMLADGTLKKSDHDKQVKDAEGRLADQQAEVE